MESIGRRQKMKGFCISCNDEVEYNVFADRVETDIRGTKISYVEVTAICSHCGEEMYVPEVNDANVKSQRDAYRTAMHLITIDELREILDKYSIGAGPLANILEVGEVTLNRYLLGQLPSKAISEKLYSIRKDRKLMRNYLEKNKKKISDIAYTKCKDALDKLDYIIGQNKIDTVARYMLIQNFDITQLALQKLLYYAQGFYHAIFGEDLFLDDCQAWAHGPVYPDIYSRYKGCGSEPISAKKEQEDFCELTDREKSFLDTVILIFGFYSGIMLSKITHAEKPWLDARGNLKPEDRCSNIIDRKAINDYFDEVVKKYDITSPVDMKKYCIAMLG